MTLASPAPATALRNAGKRRARASKGAVTPVLIGLGEILGRQRREGLGRHRDGVVDENVEPRRAPAKKARTRSKSPMSNAARSRRSRWRFSSPSKIFEPGIVAAVEDDMRAGFASAQRHGAPQMARGARDESNATVEPEQCDALRGFIAIRGHCAGSSRRSGSARHPRSRSPRNRSATAARFTNRRRLVSSWSSVSIPTTTPSMKSCPLA